MTDKRKKSPLIANYRLADITLQSFKKEKTSEK